MRACCVWDIALPVLTSCGIRGGSENTNPYLRLKSKVQSSCAASMPKMRTATFLALLVGSAVVHVSAQDAPTVKIVNGTLQGAKCPSNDVNSFLGIPYAQPPVGDLRFAPPQSYNQTFDNRQAVQPPPACAQFNVAFAESGPQSEDW